MKKKISFYIDFDERSRKCKIPNREVEYLETMNRITSLIGPMNSALKVKDLVSNECFVYKKAFSDYAMKTLTYDMYQQDVLDVLLTMRCENKYYNNAIDDIRKLFIGGRN